MAIPDTVVNDYYFYISGYQDYDSIDTADFKPLSLGVWKNDGFKGAVLAVKDVGISKGLQFFNEAFQTYRM